MIDDNTTQAGAEPGETPEGPDASAGTGSEGSGSTRGKASAAKSGARSAPKPAKKSAKKTAKAAKKAPAKSAEKGAAAAPKKAGPKRGRSSATPATAATAATAEHEVEAGGEARVEAGAQEGSGTGEGAPRKRTVKKVTARKAAERSAGASMSDVEVGAEVGADGGAADAADARTGDGPGDGAESVWATPWEMGGLIASGERVPEGADPATGIEGGTGVISGVDPEGLAAMIEHADPIGASIGAVVDEPWALGEGLDDAGEEDEDEGADGDEDEGHARGDAAGAGARAVPGEAEHRRRRGRRPTRPPRAEGDAIEVERRAYIGPPSELIVNYVPGEDCRIALLEGGRLEEFHAEPTERQSRVGNIYVGKVTNVESQIQAAFVDFGLKEAGFLHVSDLHPRYFPGGEGESERVGRKTPRRERPPIQQCLKRGQEIIVQVLKEGVGTKGPSVTSYLSIPGRSMVMMPEMDRVGVSRKVEDEDQRRKMRKILDDLDLPDGFGFILRTAGFDRTREELDRDLTYLKRLWADMERRRGQGRGPRLLYAESDLLLRTLRDHLTPSVKRVVIDNEHALRRAAAYLNLVSAGSGPRVERYTGEVPIFHAFGVEEQLDLMLATEVPLPSGGRLIIEQTEALVAIDVNSGKSRGAVDAEANAFNTNLEAVDEIARQLRLRDLGGLVINDLIDMRLASNRKKIEERFVDRLGRDRARSTILPISQFGILEMTRQRMRGSYEQQHFHECPTCHGRGLSPRADSVASRALRELGVLLASEKIRRVELVVSPRVAGSFLGPLRASLSRTERLSGKRVDVRVSETLPVGRFNFYAYDEKGGDVDLDRLPRARVKPRTEPLRPDQLEGGDGLIDLLTADPAAEAAKAMAMEAAEAQAADDALAASLAPPIRPEAQAKPTPPADNGRPGSRRPAARPSAMSASDVLGPAPTASADSGFGAPGSTGPGMTGKKKRRRRRRRSAEGEGPAAEGASGVPAADGSMGDAGRGDGSFGGSIDDADVPMDLDHVPAHEPIDDAEIETDTGFEPGDDRAEDRADDRADDDDDRADGPGVGPLGSSESAADGDRRRKRRRRRRRRRGGSEGEPGPDPSAQGGDRSPDRSSDRPPDRPLDRPARGVGDGAPEGSQRPDDRSRDRDRDRDRDGDRGGTRGRDRQRDRRRGPSVPAQPDARPDARPPAPSPAPEAPQPEPAEVGVKRKRRSIFSGSRRSLSPSEVAKIKPE